MKKYGFMAFPPLQRVWVIHENRVMQMDIKKVTVIVDSFYPVEKKEEIIYSLYGGVSGKKYSLEKTQNDIFETKEELLKTL